MWGTPWGSTSLLLSKVDGSTHGEPLTASRLGACYFLVSSYLLGLFTNIQIVHPMPGLKSMDFDLSDLQG